MLFVFYKFAIVNYLYKHVVKKNIKDGWKPKWLNFQQGKEILITVEFKKQVVSYTKRSAASHYGAEPKRVRDWKKDLEKR